MKFSPDDPDYYHVLRVAPDCDPKALELSYKQLAKQYHPDHSATADLARFKEITAAYRVLRDAKRRAQYDEANPHFFAVPHASPAARSGLDQSRVANDALVHENILMLLYNLRRESAEVMGAGDWKLVEMTGCSEKNLQFHTWYLKEKGYIAINEEGTWAITIAGVDHVIETMRSRQETAPLLIQRRDNMVDLAEDDEDAEL